MNVCHSWRKLNIVCYIIKVIKFKKCTKTLMKWYQCKSPNLQAQNIHDRGNKWDLWHIVRNQNTDNWKVHGTLLSFQPVKKHLACIFDQQQQCKDIPRSIQSQVLIFDTGIFMNISQQQWKLCAYQSVSLIWSMSSSSNEQVQRMQHECPK